MAKTFIFFLICTLFLAGGVVAKDKITEILSLKSDITQAQSIILKAKGYDNASVSELSCDTTSCNYDFFVNGEKKKTQPLPLGYNQFNEITNETDYIYYTNAELIAYQEQAVKDFYVNEYNRLTITQTITKKGSEKQIGYE